jgi:hypothetical protein
MAWVAAVPNPPQKTRGDLDCSFDRLRWGEAACEACGDEAGGEDANFESRRTELAFMLHFTAMPVAVKSNNRLAVDSFSRRRCWGDGMAAV